MKCSFNNRNLLTFFSPWHRGPTKCSIRGSSNGRKLILKNQFYQIFERRGKQPLLSPHSHPHIGKGSFEYLSCIYLFRSVYSFLIYEIFTFAWRHVSLTPTLSRPYSTFLILLFLINVMQFLKSIWRFFKPWEPLKRRRR